MYEDDISDDSGINLCFEQYINIRGVSDEAHTYYHNRGKLTNRFYQRYKICDDGKCILCNGEHKELYNFCDNNHDDSGVCFECFTKMKAYECPVCHEKIVEYNCEALLCELLD